MAKILQLDSNINGVYALCRRLNALMIASQKLTDDVLDAVIDEINIVSDKLTATPAVSVDELLFKLDAFLAIQNDDCDGACSASRGLQSIRNDVSLLSAKTPLID
jgi:hypothetical protein